MMFGMFSEAASFFISLTLSLSVFFCMGLRSVASVHKNFQILSLHVLHRGLLCDDTRNLNGCLSHLRDRDIDHLFRCVLLQCPMIFSFVRNRGTNLAESIIRPQVDL